MTDAAARLLKGQEGLITGPDSGIGKAFSRIDIVVAIASLQKDSAIANMTLNESQAVLAINLTGQFLCVREAIRRFLAQRLAPASKTVGLRAFRRALRLGAGGSVARLRRSGLSDRHDTLRRWRHEPLPGIS